MHNCTPKLVNDMTHKGSVGLAPSRPTKQPPRLLFYPHPQLEKDNWYQFQKGPSTRRQAISLHLSGGVPYAGHLGSGGLRPGNGTKEDDHVSHESQLESEQRAY